MLSRPDAKNGAPSGGRLFAFMNTAWEENVPMMDWTNFERAPE